jgi:hypothetical protein
MTALEQMKQRLEAATKGPWELFGPLRTGWSSEFYYVGDDNNLHMPDARRYDS